MQIVYSRNYEHVLSAKLAAPIDGYAPPAHWTRKQLRSLEPVSQMCVEAGERALADAGLLDDPGIRDGRMGVASGSSTGSTRDICDMAKLIMDGRSDGFSANTYIRMMPHTTAANLAIFFGLQGRLIPTSSACTSGSQAIGYAYEAIRFGLIPMMLAGGGEELCHSEVCVFDSLYAASLKNDAPKTTPAPYDRDRDGLVIGEGAGMLVLESLASAQARGARIYAEIIGFASNCDGTHVTRPEQATMYRCMACTAAWRWRLSRRAPHRKPSATSAATALRPNRAILPKRWPPPASSRAVCRSARRRATSATLWAPAACWKAGLR